MYQLWLVKNPVTQTALILHLWALEYAEKQDSFGIEASLTSRVERKLQLQTCPASHSKANYPAGIVSRWVALLDSSDMIHWSGVVATNA